MIIINKKHYIAILYYVVIIHSDIPLYGFLNIFFHKKSILTKIIRI